MQVIYKETITPKQAFETFKKAVYDPTPSPRVERIMSTMNLRQDVNDTIEYVIINTRHQSDDDGKLTWIVVVVVVSAVLLIGVLVLRKIKGWHSDAPTIKRSYNLENTAA